MILTLTPNPSVDRTAVLTSRLERGAVLRAESVLSQSGGKGVNISRAATAAGVPTVAVVPADERDPYVLELLRDGIDCRPERPSGPVRVNLTISEPDGTTTKINTPGATADAESLARLATAVREGAQQAEWVVLAGSLPPGAPADWYAALVRSLREAPAKVAVDTSGAALAAFASAGAASAPDLLKPNGEELASLAGADPQAVEGDPAEAVRAAAVLVDRGVGAVLATLGGSGAVLVTASGAWHAVAPPTSVVSTVGAGDSSLFGYILGDIRGDTPPDRLCLAVAYGTAAVSLPGTTIPVPAQVRADLVRVRGMSLPSTDR